MTPVKDLNRVLYRDFLPFSSEQAESLLEGFTPGNYGIVPFLRQPDFYGSSLAFFLRLA